MQDDEIGAENGFRAITNINPKFVDAFKHHLVDMLILRFYIFRTTLPTEDFKSRVEKLANDQHKNFIHALYGKKYMYASDAYQLFLDFSKALEAVAPFESDLSRHKILHVPADSQLYCKPQCGGYTGFLVEHLRDQVYGICSLSGLFIPVTKINSTIGCNDSVPRN